MEALALVLAATHQRVGSTFSSWAWEKRTQYDNIVLGRGWRWICGLQRGRRRQGAPFHGNTYILPRSLPSSFRDEGCEALKRLSLASSAPMFSLPNFEMPTSCHVKQASWKQGFEIHHSILWLSPSRFPISAFVSSHHWVAFGEAYSRLTKTVNVVSRLLPRRGGSASPS